MKVTPLDRATFHVESRSEPNPRFVDLVAYRQNGQCDCPDFRCKKEPKLKAGAPGSPALRCAHINAAREYLVQRVLANLAIMFPDDKQTT